MFRRVLGILALITFITIPFNVLSAAAAPSGRATLTGNVPPWATAANFKSSTNSSDDIGFRVYLNWQNQSAIEALATVVTDPASPSYGQFLTPQQFRRQYAPSQKSVHAVQSWLRSQGFNVVYTPTNNLYVSAEGTVAQAAAAFGTSFGQYQVTGLTLRSPESDISVPSSIAPLVSGVIGLDDSAQLVQTFKSNDPRCSSNAGLRERGTVLRLLGPATGNRFHESLQQQRQDLPSTCRVDIHRSRFSEPTGWQIQLTTAPVRRLLSLMPLPHQRSSRIWISGRKIAVCPRLRFSRSSHLARTVTRKRKRQDPQGWYGEETLDVEAVHGMAPGANIIYVGAPNAFQDLDAALNHVVDRHLASIVTNSYGWNTELLPPGFVKPFNSILLQGAAEGIGIYFSSGDFSDESLVVGYATPDFPASSPWVTAVGGTSLAVDSSGNYLFETGWGTSYSSWTDGNWDPQAPGFWIYGAGGGVSRLFAEPSYQLGVVPQSVFAAQGRTGRAVPDIARGRRSEHWLPDRANSDLPGRQRRVFGVSNWRNESLIPADGRHHGPGGPGCRRSAWVC